MLSDHEQRAIEELERCYATEAVEPARSGPPTRRSARPSRGRRRFLVVLACVGVCVLINVPAAAPALVLAALISWLAWRLWSHSTDGARSPAPTGIAAAGQGSGAASRRPGESIRQYLRWLAEAD